MEILSVYVHWVVAYIKELSIVYQYQLHHLTLLHSQSVYVLAELFSTSLHGLILIVQNSFLLKIM